LSGGVRGVWRWGLQSVGECSRCEQPACGRHLILSAWRNGYGNVEYERADTVREYFSSFSPYRQDTVGEYVPVPLGRRTPTLILIQWNPMRRLHSPGNWQ
jgi:hypothetical protein